MKKNGEKVSYVLTFIAGMVTMAGLICFIAAKIGDPQKGTNGSKTQGG